MVDALTAGQTTPQMDRVPTMEIEDIMRDLLTLFRERQLGVPIRFRVDFADGRNPIDLPFDLVRTISSTGSGTPSTHRRNADDGPATIAAAIRLALFLRDHRLTGGQLVQAIRDEWPDKPWDNDSIGTEASRMVREGELKNYRTDPQDGRGKGYSRIDWEPSADAENGGSNGG